MPNTTDSDKPLDYNLEESANKQQSYVEASPFMIDYTNRLIRPIPSATSATASQKFLKLNRAFLPSGVVECDATVVSVIGTAAASPLNSYVIPLNTISRNYAGSGTSGTEFRKAGNAFRVRAAGIYTTDDATATFSLGLSVGGTTYHNIGSTAATVTAAPWNIDWLFIVSAIGSSGTVESQLSAKINNVNKDSAQTGTIAINTTVANTILLQTVFTSGSAGDSISIRQFMVELLN